MSPLRWHKGTFTWVAGLALLALAACAPSGPPTSAPGTAPQIAHPPATRQRLSPAATPEEAVGDDRAIYLAGLITAEQARLDNLAQASIYHIELRIADDISQVTGQQRVRYTNAEQVRLDEIYFRLFPNATGGKMRIANVTVDGSPAPSRLSHADTALRVALAPPLAPGGSVEILLDYVINVPNTLTHGYGLLSFVDGVLALDSPYAPIPVYDDEGWNVETPPQNADLSYFDPSFYHVRISAPDELVLVASGLEVAREQDETTQTVTFAAGPSRDFYVAASADYEAVSVQVGETRVNSYARPEGAEGARRAAATARRALTHFNARFGAYPYTEIDLVSTPLLALGIEYPGITGLSLRLYDPSQEVSGLPALTLLESVVAHELAHQWFYSLVGSDQVDEPWLDEALAQYATALYFQDTYGAAAADQYRASWASRWARVGRADVPIGLPAGEYSGQEYGAIVYGRGPFFLDALARRMGQATFDRFLAEYVAAHRWGIADRAGFEAQAETICQCSLDDLFAAWVDRN